MATLGSPSLNAYARQLGGRPSWRWSGRVVEANELTVESEGPFCSVGECCEIVDGDGTRHSAEVIGFRGGRVVMMPLQPPHGIRFGDAVLATGTQPTFRLGHEMTGRVVNAIGVPIDGDVRLCSDVMWALDGSVPQPMERVPIKVPLQTGVKVLDGMLTVGRGQRVGIFGGSGVGKSTLIGMMTRNTGADLTVVGLVGERGREVREFIEDSLGEEGLARSVLVVSTSDQSPLLRMRAAMAATALAEYHAGQGKHVLLVLDSLTRYAMAAREIGLAAGEPPASKGYTPSVFAKLARLVERAGNFQNGSITAFYTVLMEGDDQQDPIVDSVRSLLDGHVVLSREMAAAGWFPPVNVLDSLSRLMPAVTTREHRAKAIETRKMLSSYSRSEDLIRIGAYKAGSDPELDRAVQAMPKLRGFLEQQSTEQITMQATINQLRDIEI